MSVSWIWALGTVLIWTGWISVFRIALTGLRMLFGRETGQAEQHRRTIARSAGVAGACLLVASFLPMKSGLEEADGWALPLVWFLMPFPAFAALFCGVFIVVRGVQSWTAITTKERKARLSAVGVWSGLGALFLVWFFKDEVWLLMPFPAFPAFAALVCGVFVAVRGVQSWTAITAEERKAHLGALGVWSGLVVLFLVWFFKGEFWFSADVDEVSVFRGVVSVTPMKLVAISLIGVAAVGVMVWTEKMARLRGLAKTVVTHVVLIAGCIVFGIPFAWLLVTSFKEDRDITTTHGMVWVPRVQETVSYKSPDNPYYETEYRGSTVKGKIAATFAEDRVEFEIERPFNKRGRRFIADRSALTEIPRDAKVVTTLVNGTEVQGYVVEELENARRRVRIQEPPAMAGQEVEVAFVATEPVRKVGLRWQNYTEMMEWMPEGTAGGMVYLKNTIILVVMSVIGTVFSSAMVGYGLSRLRFPGRNQLFGLMLATMMLPAAVTMLPTFLIFRWLGWIDTLYPLWVPAFFSTAFNVFLMRQFFKTIPMELEDAAKIDGCSYVRTLFQVMLPQIQPVLATISIWTFMGAWNNFMGPLIYISSPEKMPIAYALQMFQGERTAEYGLLMAFSTLATIPVLLLFFFAQRYFIEGVQLSGLGGR